MVLNHGDRGHPTKSDTFYTFSMFCRKAPRPAQGRSGNRARVLAPPPTPGLLS